MIIRIFFTITLCIVCFFLGFTIGKNKDDNRFDKVKKYTIKFDKAEVKGKVIKSSYIINEILQFCDTIGIEVLDLKIESFGHGTLIVECTKNQHLLLISELSKNENMLDLINIGI